MTVVQLIDSNIPYRFGTVKNQLFLIYRFRFSKKEKQPARSCFLKVA